VLGKTGWWWNTFNIVLREMGFEEGMLIELALGCV
jgi:hypothetical protein